MQAVDYVWGHYGISLRRACQLVHVSRSAPYYERRKDPRPELQRRMRKLANTRVCWGYRRPQVLLRREGWALCMALGQRCPRRNYGGRRQALGNS
jgi:putative transposase